MVGILSTVKIRYLDYYLETIVNINLIYQAGGIYQSKRWTGCTVQTTSTATFKI